MEQQIKKPLVEFIKEIAVKAYSAGLGYTTYENTPSFVFFWGGVDESVIQEYEPVSAPSVPEIDSDVVDQVWADYAQFIPDDNTSPLYLGEDWMMKSQFKEAIAKLLSLSSVSSSKSESGQIAGVQWVKASERLPERSNPPNVYIVKWLTIGRHLRTMLTTRNHLADLVKANIEIEYFWLDESSSSLSTGSRREYLKYLGFSREEGEGKISASLSTAKEHRLSREALRQEIWSMLTDECRKIMEPLKESYFDSIMADIDAYKGEGKEQETAIAFAEWVEDSGSTFYSGTKMWRNGVDPAKTSQEMYALFLQSQTKQQS